MEPIEIQETPPGITKEEIKETHKHLVRKLEELKEFGADGYVCGVQASGGVFLLYGSPSGGDLGEIAFAIVDDLIKESKASIKCPACGAIGRLVYAPNASSPGD